MRKNEEDHKGLGDLVELFTRFTGIKWIVKKFTKITGIDCGCDKRRDNWNKIKLDRWN